MVHADTPWGDLQVAHGVISLCSNQVFSTNKFPLVFWPVGVELFNLYLEINLLVQRNTTWQLVLELKRWLGFERGSKWQILGSLTAHKFVENF